MDFTVKVEPNDGKYQKVREKIASHAPKPKNLISVEKSGKNPAGKGPTSEEGRNLLLFTLYPQVELPVLSTYMLHTENTDNATSDAVDVNEQNSQQGNSFLAATVKDETDASNLNGLNSPSSSSFLAAMVKDVTDTDIVHVTEVDMQPYSSLIEEPDAGCLKEEMIYNFPPCDEKPMGITQEPSGLADRAIGPWKLEDTIYDPAPPISVSFGMLVDSLNLETPPEVKELICNERRKTFDRNRLLNVRKSLGETGQYAMDCKKSFSKKQHPNREKFYSCIECQSLVTSGDLKNHSKTHSGEKPHSSNECRRALLTLHSILRSGEKPHSCTGCLKSFKTSRGLTLHSVIHSGEKPHSCTKCQESFKTSWELKIHSRTQCEGKPHAGIECQERFSTSWDEKMHEREKPHSCTECHKSFKTSWALKIHSRTHSGERPHRCTECQKGFSTSGNLKNHYSRIHSREKAHPCTECHKSFSTSGNLKVHLRAHSWENPHSCTECQKHFKGIRDLKRHSKIHSGQKPHSCTQCQKSFMTSWDLKIHRRTHSGVKPHTCAECQKSFSTTGNLKNHLSRIHSGDKPHPCTV